MKMLLAILMLVAGIVQAVEYPELYSPSGYFMGEVTTDHWRPDAISNDFGRYGSDLSPDSINNEYSNFGSEFSYESPYYIGRPGSLRRPPDSLAK